MRNAHGLENLRELSQKSMVPELQKSISRARIDARLVARGINEQVSRLNIFTPARLHSDEIRTLTVLDKSKRAYEFTVDSNGKNWGVFGYSIHPCLNFIHGLYSTDQEFNTAVTQALDSQKNHVAFHKKLNDIHTLIGTCILLGRSVVSKNISEHSDYIRNEKNTSLDPSQWYESHLTFAEHALRSIESTFLSLKERCSDALTHSFLDDYRKECELLIVECCFFSFLLLDGFMTRLRKHECALPIIIKDSPFTISPSDYMALENDIRQLRNGYNESFGERLDTVFPLPEKKKILETGEIHLPAYVSINDLDAILSNYSILWEQIAYGLSSGKAHVIRGGKAQVANTMEIGLQSGSAHSQDRLSFRMPSFNIRVDKDTRRNMLTLDVGSVSLMHALFCAEEFLVMPQMNNKLPAIFKKDAKLANKEVLLENKMALLASVMMNASQPVGLRKKPTISHHSREFVAKDDYYNNFTHILACIKDGLEHPPK